jgi:hypothetical protein
LYGVWRSPVLGPPYTYGECPGEQFLSQGACSWFMFHSVSVFKP